MDHHRSPSKEDAREGALSGLRVLDCATLIAGPTIATLMGDFGADVIKIEHPQGDALRTLGWEKDGISLWWAMANRNKRCITLDFSKPQGQEILKELVVHADLLIEGFRPGRMEGWGLGYEQLSEINPQLIMVRVTGFGQTGPYRDRPGFGTLAESISGFAQINGPSDGPPTLPPFALGDTVAALFGTFASMMALYHRAQSPDSGGQVIDLSIYEPMFSILGPQTLVFDQLGTVQERTGNRATFTSPRNSFRAKDGQWLGLSASSQSIADRLIRLVGREDLLHEEWFRSHRGRREHEDELDEILGDWIGQREGKEVVDLFEQFEAAIAPMYSIVEIFADPHYKDRESITTVDHPKLGPVRTSNVVPRLSKTPGKIRHLGDELGSANYDVFVNLLGHEPEEIVSWEKEKVVSEGTANSPAPPLDGA